MVRVIVGSLVTGVVLFLWGFVYWTVLALPMDIYRAVPGDQREAFVTAVRGALPESGVYFYPAPDPEMEPEVSEQIYQAGPIVQVFYHQAGASQMSPGTFFAGWLHMVVTAAMIGGVLRSLNLAGFRQRWCLAASIGLIAAVWVDLGKPIWFHHDLGFSLFCAGYEVTAWIIGGAVLAALLKSPGGRVSQAGSMSN